MYTENPLLACIEPLERRLFLSTYYVSQVGRDNATGSADDPFPTLQHAADIVAPGDTVFVKPGTYAGFFLMTSGTPSARITFKADPGVLVNYHNQFTYDAINLERASYITIEGFKVTPRADTFLDVGIRSVENTDVIIRNNDVDRASWWGILASFSENVLIENNVTANSINQHGIYVANSGDNPVIRSNLIFGNNMAGIHLNGDATYGGDGVISNALIESNVIYDNGERGASGINGDGLQNSIIRHNLLYNNHSSGISLYRADGRESSTHNLVINNTVLMPPGANWALNIQDGSTDNTACNNILLNEHAWRGSINISPDSLPGFASNYNALTPRFSTQDTPGEMGLREWRLDIGQDLDSIVATPQQLFLDPAKGDYRLSPNSPAIDAGNPLTPFLREFAPNGGRANLGHQGNTPKAALSSSPSVRFLSPNGYERFELDNPLTIAWQSAGLTLARPVALINTGSTFPAGDFLPNAYQTLAFSAGSFDDAVDLSSLSDPAPADVYKTYASAQPGVGNRIAWSLPVPDGTYTLRLHFADPLYDQPSQRRFDIKLQGAVVSAAYDIAAAAKARYKAADITLPVTAANGKGIRLELVNLTDSPAILSAIELTQPDPAGLLSPTFNLELSTDDGRSWNPLASNLPVDRFGRGSFQWTPNVLAESARIRITANTKAAPSDTSDASFRIVSPGRDYYINDASTAGDVFTTAPGNNANTGKSPDQPMASLAALLAAYDLEAGDVIHVDTGLYNPLGNIVIDAQDSGVRIEGPSTATALFDLNSRLLDTAVFELRNADDITLDHLSFTGGQYGLYVADGSDSDRLTISNCTFFGNDDFGVWIGPSNDRPVLSSNTLYGISNTSALDDQSTGIHIAAPNATVTHNTLHDNAFAGIRITGPNSTVSANTVSGSRGIGIYVAAGSVTNNIVHHNGVGIAVTSGATASRNTVYDNRDGIITADSLGPGPFTIWDDSVVPAVRAENDSDSVEVGLRFRSDIAGYITGIRFYKGPGNTGTHIGSLWNNDGELLTSATFTNETATGWQTLTFPNPVLIAANTTYVASYHAPRGHYALDDGYFTRYAQDSGPLHALQNNDDGPNGVYYYDPDPSFPTSSFARSHYWVDVVFTPSLSSDTVYQPSSAVVTHNRVFNNTHNGILASNDSTVSSNLVYSNAIGIRATSFAGQITNNLVYANAQQAILLASAHGARVINNTLYQFMGNALRIESSSQSVQVRNNILQAPTGYALSITPDSQTGFSSDYNLFSPMGSIASWNGTGCPSLADWRSASGQDAHSLADDPRFLDPDGSDNLLGGPDGADDNFGLASSSPAIDRGQNAGSPALDLNSLPRYDDPLIPNADPGYVDIGAHEYQGSGGEPTPLTITQLSPAGIQSGSTQASIDKITLQFSKPLAATDAINPASYELRSAGPDHLFGTADDTLLTLEPRYTPGLASLSLDILSGPLPPDTYRLTIFAGPGRGLRDTSGAYLDGDHNGAPGGDYVATFSLYPSRLEFSAGPDALYLRLAPTDPTRLQIFHNTSLDAEPTYSLSLAALQSLTLTTLAGDDSITFDFSYGSPIPPQGLTFDAAAGADSLRIVGTPVADVLSLDATRVLFGDSTITYSNLESLRLDTADGDDTLTLAAALPFTPVFNPGIGNDTLSILAGSYDLSPNTLLATANLNLVAAGSSALRLLASMQFASLALKGQARVKLVAGGKSLQTRSLAVAPNAALDLADGALFVETPVNSAAALSSITDWVRTGRNNGAWNGLGLTSSTARSSKGKGLAVLLHDPAAGSIIRSPRITPPAGTPYVLVLSTWDGDINADGVVDAADYFRIDSGYITQKPGYQNGDLNHDNVVDAADYFLVDSAFLAQSAQNSPSLQPVASHWALTPSTEHFYLTPALRIV